MKVLCILDNGFEELETVGVLALLARANIPYDIYAPQSACNGRFNIGISPIKVSNNLDCSTYDVLFIPGGPHIQKLKNYEWVREVIKHFVDNNKMLSAICAGPTLLGEFNYLKGKKYTCFTSMNQDYQGTYIDDYIVKDKNLITGRSVAATIDFALALIEYCIGKEECDKLKLSIYY